MLVVARPTPGDRLTLTWVAPETRQRRSTVPSSADRASRAEHRRRLVVVEVEGQRVAAVSGLVGAAARQHGGAGRRRVAVVGRGAGGDPRKGVRARPLHGERVVVPAVVVGRPGRRRGDARRRGGIEPEREGDGSRGIAGLVGAAAAGLNACRIRAAVGVGAAGRNPEPRPGSEPLQSTAQAVVVPAAGVGRPRRQPPLHSGASRRSGTRAPGARRCCRRGRCSVLPSSHCRCRGRCRSAGRCTSRSRRWRRCRSS